VGQGVFYLQICFVERVRRRGASGPASGRPVGRQQRRLVRLGVHAAQARTAKQFIAPSQNSRLFPQKIKKVRQGFCCRINRQWPSGMTVTSKMGSVV